MVETLFEQYRKRLVRNGIIKSLIFALIVGFAVDGIVALITWFVADMTVGAILGLSIGLGVAVIAASTPVFYFRFFRPTTYQIAQRLDDLGLEERMITMCELEQDPSYIAMKQRDDAQVKLGGVKAKSLKLTVSMMVIVLLIASFVFAAGLTTVSAFAATGAILKGSDIGKGDNDGIIDEDNYFTVNYLIYSGNGVIEGDTIQIVEKGKNTTQVTAVPDEGYVFYKWTDETGEETFGVSATRMEFNVQKDMNLYAVFQPIESGDGSGNEGGNNTERGDGGDQEEGGEQGDTGNEGGEGEGEGDGGEPDDGSQGDKEDTGNGDGESQDGENEPGENDNDKKDENNPGNPGEGAGEGGSHQNNKVIDGERDYQNEFDRGKHQDDLAKDDTIPDDLKDILGDYYESLKP